MKVGVCYFGQPRLCETGLVTEDWFIQSNDVEIHNYFHLWQSSNSNELINSISRFEHEVYNSYDLQWLIENYNPIDYKFELQKEFDITKIQLEDTSVHRVYPNRVISMLYSINETIKLVNDYTLDVLILKRTDLKFQNKIDLKTLDLKKLNMPDWRGTVSPNTMYTTHPVYVDFIAIGTLDILQSYASLYTKIQYFSHEKCWIPEYLFADHIVNEKLEVNEINLGELYTNYS